MYSREETASSLILSAFDCIIFRNEAICCEITKSEVLHALLSLDMMFERGGDIGRSMERLQSFRSKERG